MSHKPIKLTVIPTPPEKTRSIIMLMKASREPLTVTGLEDVPDGLCGKCGAVLTKGLSKRQIIDLQREKLAHKMFLIPHGISGFSETISVPLDFYLVAKDGLVISCPSCKALNETSSLR